MPQVALVEAVNLALAHEMQADPSVVLLGEDIGVNGGVFRATVGLQKKFGKDRVIDTPLAEISIAGISIGMAAQGLKPVAEVQFMGFVPAMLDQVICHASRLRNRTRGRLGVPMVLRAPSGGGIHSPEHHSESYEALFAHIPGIRVVVPSTPARAYGLLLASIRDPDPVVFLEPIRIYRMMKQEVEDNGKALPLDTCFIEREGTDITLLGWGASMHEVRLAADELSKQGIHPEIIDVATVKPLDMETILESVAKTTRCVIVQEAYRTCSVASEIAAQIAEKGLLTLASPIIRVDGYDTIIPLYRLEHHYIPNVARILQAAKQTLEFA